MFCHYSSNSIDVLKSHKQVANYFKPQGIWFARGESWLEWCKYAEFSTGDYKYLYSLEKYDKDKIYWVKDPLAFIDMYYENNTYRWDTLAEKYDGVYLPTMSISKLLALGPASFKDYGLSNVLFYGLDVDSLVIWDTENIKLKLVEHNKSGFFEN